MNNPTSDAQAAAARSNEILELLGNYEAVLQDLPRWQREQPKSPRDLHEAFVTFWSTRQEFRSVVRYRVKRFADPALSKRFQALCGAKPWMFVTNFFLSCDEIGPGLYVEHGFSTIVYARKIGENFRVNQNVTVGSGKGGHPVIGNDVSIYTGAIVIGSITIGHRVKIGAGAVCVESVPADSTVVPAKSRVISRKA